jgi:hypothetical protein
MTVTGAIQILALVGVLTALTPLTPLHGARLPGRARGAERALGFGSSGSSIACLVDGSEEQG